MSGVQYEWRKDLHRHTQEEDHAKTQREDRGLPSANQGESTQKKPTLLITSPQISRIQSCEEINC
jgi:hypothetical protein